MSDENKELNDGDKKASDFNGMSDAQARENNNNRGEASLKEKKGMKIVETGWYVLEFTKKHGTKKPGEQETYHSSTAKALVDKLEVAKVVEKLKKYVPKKENKA